MTTKTEPDNPAELYICIDERVGRWLYSYYNKTLSVEAAQSFEEHLLLCFKCQETILELDCIFDMLRVNREQLFGPEEPSKKKNVVKTKCKA